MHQTWALNGFTTTHCVLHKSTLNTTLHILHFTSECFCVFIYMLLHSLKLLHSNFRHCVHEKEALENTVLQLKVSDVLGLSENGALVGYKTRLKWITPNANANHRCNTVCRGLWHMCDDSCYHWTYTSKNTSSLQQLRTVTQFCASLKDRPRVWKGYLH